MEEVIKKRSVDHSGGDREDGGGEGDIFEHKIGSKRTYHEMDDRKSASPQQEELSLTKQVFVSMHKDRSNMRIDSKASPNQKEKKEQLESARAEMGEVREENQRLKTYLDRIMKDYQTLKMQFYEIVQKDEKKQSEDHAIHNNDHRETIEEPAADQLVSLSLGRCSSTEPDKINGKIYNKKNNGGKDVNNDYCEQDKKELALGLDWKFEAAAAATTSKSVGNEQRLSLGNNNNNIVTSPLNSSEECKEEGGEAWHPSKLLKTSVARSAADNEEVLQQNPVKKTRVSVRARCDTPTMNDGCQWRKYGQKIAKGNPCPRAYYRCTVAPSCPVRKQVQRCAEDMSILITTYEGTHNHPLPISATAMASTTSAAASMLLSGSSTTTRTATAAALQGLNFYLSDNSNTSKHFYLHNSSLNPSLSHPTVTLDLTSNPTSSLFNRSSFSSTYPLIPKFTPASLNFCSSDSNAPPWGGGASGSFLTYGSSTTTQPYNRQNQLGNLNLGRQNVDNNMFSYQSYINQKTTSNQIPPQQPMLPDTIAAATKAITADPSFQSALATALQTIIGSGGTGGENLAQKLKFGENFPVLAGSGYVDKNGSTSNSCPVGSSLTFMPPPLPLSSPRSASASPSNSRDHSSS